MSHPLRRRRLPDSVIAATAVLGIVSLYHLGVALATLIGQSDLRVAIALQRPRAGAEAIEQMLASATALSLAVHLPLFILTALLSLKLPTGHPFALRPATVSQLFGVAFAYASAPPFRGLQPLIPMVIAVQAAVVVLLWIPPASRAYFAAHPKSSRSRQNAASSRTVTRH